VVTFLFTDIEGSTRRWESDPDAMREALAAHDEVLRHAIEARGGWMFKHTGDGACAAFSSPRAAVEAATDAQRVLALPVRMGIATGEAEQRGDDYFGPILNRTARITAAGHGGQILVTSSMIALVDGLEVIALGERRLRDLSEPVEIFQVRAEGLRVEFPALRTMDMVPGNLPAQSTSFVGREVDLAAVIETLRANRLVTLVGVGGVGKTRLALHAAAALSGEYRDGAWFIELASILDAAEVSEAVAAVFTVAPQADRSWRDGVTETLRARQLLLVLDNCEHVLDEAAPLIEALVARCPGITILATSREALGVGGESVSPVPSLEVGNDSPASALFVERAHAAAPDFDPDDDDDSVAEICRRLDGIPLAIELAAARVRAMSPAQIRDRLDERFRLLTGSRRSLERHQTLRHAVQWSYDLLSDVEQRVLQRAAVFAGGFSLAAATVVCGHTDLDDLETLDVLDSLVRKSLLQVERSTELRYTMLETIRQFAEERLAENANGVAVRDRHASFFADRAETMFDVFRGPEAALTYRFVDDEIANLRAAFRWSIDRNQPDPAIHIAACVHQAARMRLRTETFGWAAEVAESARLIEHRLLPLVLTMAADSAWGLGLLDEAKRYGHEAIAVADDPRFEPIVWAYADLAQIALFEGDVDASLELARTGAAHPADRRDRLNLGALILMRGTVGRPTPDDEFETAMAQVNEAGFPMAIAFAQSGRAIGLAPHDIEAAIALEQQVIDMLESCGDRLLEQATRAQLVSLIASTDDLDRALATFTEIVNAWRISGDTLLAQAIGQLVVLLVRLGYYDGATQLYGAVTRSVILDALVPELDASIAGARDAMGEADFVAARATGAALSYQAAGELACDLISTARARLNPSK
jgi:predicted ATPase